MGERRVEARAGCHYDMCNQSALVLPLCLLVKPRSSATPEGWLSYSQYIIVSLTITSVLRNMSALPPSSYCKSLTLGLHLVNLT